MDPQINWRPYTPADLSLALTLKEEQDRVLGQPMDFCDLSKHPVLIAEFAEIDGQAIGLHTIEAVPEYCVFSRNPKFTVAAARRAPQISKLLQENGFRSIRCLVPEWLGRDTETIVEALAATGFKPHTGCRQMVLDLRIRS